MKHLKNGARNIAIALEVWCLSILIYSVIISMNRMKQYACDVVLVLLPLPSAQPKNIC